MQYLGDFPEDATVYIPFNTFSSNDPQASVTATTLILSDLYVHKDGSITNIVTDGATVVIDYDGIAGNHLITIDTSAHADYSVGSDYLVRIEGATVDAGLINAIVGSFSIENRFGSTITDDWTNGGRLDAIIDLIKTAVDAIKVSTDKIPLSDGTTSWNATALAAINTQADLALTDYDPPTRTEATSDKDEIVTDLTDIKGTSFIKDTHSLIDIKTETALIVADTNELQVDDVPGLIATAQTDLDTITGSDGVTLATAQGLYAPNKVVPDAAGVAPTAAEIETEIWDALQSAHVIADSMGAIATEIAAVKAETVLIVADTGELQVDDYPTSIAALQTDLDTLTAGVTLAAGAVTNASLAGNMEIVFETDFATNYNITDNAWVTNGTSFVGTGWNVAKTGYALTTADWNVGKTGYTLTATTGLGAQTANITGNLSGSVGSVTGAVGSVTGSVGSNVELGPAEVAAELATYDGPTNAEMEARTPSAAELAYIVSNAALGVPVTITTSGGSTTACVFNLVDGSAGDATDDHYNGRILVFDSGSLAGQATDITDYVGSSTTATITAITEAPTSSHTARLI